MRQVHGGGRDFPSKPVVLRPSCSIILSGCPRNKKTLRSPGGFRQGVGLDFAAGLMPARDIGKGAAPAAQKLYWV
jgi:hypothetical protein